MSTGTCFCEIKLKRAKDVTDRDVIRLTGSQIVRVDGEKSTRPGQLTLDSNRRGTITGQWREALDVYQDEKSLEEQYGGPLAASGMESLRELAEFAFNRIETCYVVVRLLIHERSLDQIEDVFAVLYRHDLLETQSLPAWEPAVTLDPVPSGGDE